jgi:hypothetical protein
MALYQNKPPIKTTISIQILGSFSSKVQNIVGKFFWSRYSSCSVSKLQTWYSIWNSTFNYPTWKINQRLETYNTIDFTKGENQTTDKTQNETSFNKIYLILGVFNTNWSQNCQITVYSSGIKSLQRNKNYTLLGTYYCKEQLMKILPT